MKRSFWIRWLVGAAILALFIIGTDFSAALDALADADTVLWMAVLPLNFVVLGLATLRSRLVMMQMGHDVPASILFSSVTLGFVAGSLTPAASGELLRTDALRTTAGVPIQDGLALVAFERLMSFYLILLSGAASAAVLLLPVGPAGAIVVLCVFGIGLPALSPLILRLLPPVGDKPTGFLPKVIHYLRTTLHRMQALFEDRWLLATWSGVTMLTFAVIAVQIWLMAESLGGGLDLIEAMFTYCGSQVLSIISLLPLGLGVYDASLAGITERAGMQEDAAVAMAVLVRATIMLPLVLLAIWANFHLSMARRKAHATATTVVVGESAAGDSTPG
jgi:lysylphosphatidylglycerol synthase-like protein